MSTVMQSVYGLMSDDLIETSYFDTKIFNDVAKEWRDRCRKQCQSIRSERANLKACRDLYKRYQLKFKISYHEQALGTFWNVYKAAHRNNILIQVDYKAAFESIIKESEAA